MNEALLHLQRGRVEDDRWNEEPSAPSPAHRFFGAALLVRASDQLPLGVRAILRWAEAEARREVGSGRAKAGTELTLGLRLAYRGLRAEAAAIRGPVPDGEEHPADAVLRALSGVRHRQRAVLILRHGLGLDAAAVATVVGIRQAEVEGILVRAEAALAKGIRRPIDVARSLGKLGRPARSRPRAAPRPAPAGAPGKAWPRPDPPGPGVAEVTRIPRAVTRVLIAPPSPAVAEATVASAPVRSAVEALIAPAPQPAVESPSVELANADILPPAPSKWSLFGRVAVAAAVGILFVWAVWPHG